MVSIWYPLVICYIVIICNICYGLLLTGSDEKNGIVNGYKLLNGQYLIVVPLIWKKKQNVYHYFSENVMDRV